MVNRERIQSIARNQLFWVVVVLSVAIIVGWPPRQNARIWPDSGSYLGFSTSRMPVYPILASALENHYVLVCVQFVLSLAVWSWLGWTVAGAIGVLVAACIAMSGPIVMWDLSVLSESISLSLLAASLASTILLYRRWTRARFIVWCVAIVLFSMTRSINVFLVPFLAVPFLATNKKRLLYVSLTALIVVAAVDIYGRTVGGSLRTLSMVNVYTGRILPDPDRRGYFIERGMPVKAEMEPFVGETGRKNARAFFEAFPEFAEWFDEEGSSMYYRWLLTQPKNYKVPAIALVRNLNFLNLQYAEGTHARPVYVYLIWFYAGAHVPWWIGWVGLLLPLLSWRLLGRVTPDSLLVPALLAGIFVQSYLGYHGDRAEVSRHILVALVLYKISLLLTVATSVNLIVQWRRQPATIDQSRPPRRQRSERSRRSRKRT